MTLDEENSLLMKPILLFLIIFTAFCLAFVKHISAIMYPLSAVIFYAYLPVLYASSRMNVLHHKKEKQEAFHIKFYPLELGLWFLSTCFLAFVISHFLSDLLFHYLQSLYHFTYFLIGFGLIGIIYCEWDVNKIHYLSKEAAFNTQGRLLSFEIFFVFFLFFAMNH